MALIKTNRTYTHIYTNKHAHIHTDTHTIYSYKYMEKMSGNNDKYVKK